jgi:hypothetical protein
MITRKYILTVVLWCLAALPALYGFDTTIFGKVRNYEDISSNSKKNALREDAMLAKSAYEDGSIPPGYRAATEAEFNQYIGQTSTQRLKYDSATGHFRSTGGWWGIDEGNGLGGRLLINEKDGSIALAFRGTEASLTDVDADVSQFLGGTPEQYKEATEILNKLVHSTEETGQQIKVVGHSLGGGEAAYATLNCDDVSRVTTTTFNAAGLSLKNVLNRNLIDRSNVITNIRVDEDVVSQTGFLLGDTYVMDSQWLFSNGDDGSLSNRLIRLIPGVTVGEKIARAKETHSIDCVILLMQDRTAPPTSSPSEGDSFSSPGENSPPGDLVSIGGTGGHASGDVCYKPDDGETGGVCHKPVEGESGGVCYMPEDEDDDTARDDIFADSNLLSAIDMWNELDAVLSSVNADAFLSDIKNSLSDNLSASLMPTSPPVLLPNVGYKRLLFLYSGEDVADTILDAVGSIHGSVGGLQSGLNSILNQQQ